MDKNDEDLFPLTPTLKTEYDYVDELAGMHNLKKVLHSLIIRPQTQPQLFENHNKICRTILLYGPPGTGKTTLVRSAAVNANANLQCVSASDFLSYYVGETEKNIKKKFSKLMKSEQLNVLFLDELDGFCRKRSHDDTDHSRRLKTELMIQLSNIERCPHVVIIGATNRPWDLDSAILRRFSRRFYIPLPNKDERLDLIKYFTRKFPIEDASDEFFEYVLKNTEGLSGSDISDLVQQAIEVPILELEHTYMWIFENGFYKPLSCHKDCVGDTENVHISNIDELPNGTVLARPVHINDFITTVNNIYKSVTQEEIERFEKFEMQKY